MLLETYLGYLYISRRNRVCIPIFAMLIFDFVFSISQGSRKLSSFEIGGGGGGAWYPLVAHRLNVIVCPYIIVFHLIITFSHTAAIFDSKMVFIILFSNYGDIKQIYVNTI